MYSKNVEILTFPWSVNFGTLLQAYALQESVRRLGFSPELINYHSKADFALFYSRKRRILQIIWDKTAKMFFGRKRREKITADFRKRYLEIQNDKYCSYESLIEKYKHIDSLSYAYIVGSDQVWNPDLVGNPDAYLFSYLPKNSKRIAYAPSFGKASILDSYKKTFKKQLLMFDAVSAREEDGAKLIKEISGLSVPVVMDPAFLLSAEEWRTIASDRLIKEKYILCYFMNTSDPSIHAGIKILAANLAKRHKCKVIYIGRKEYERLKFWEHNLFDIGPCEFLSLIDNAEYVVTNSFHATAFSLILHTPFFVPINFDVPAEKRMSNRMENLGKKFNCYERMIPCPISDSNAFSRIDGLEYMNFSIVDSCLAKLIGDSKEFLENALY